MIRQMAEASTPAAIHTAPGLFYRRFRPTVIATRHPLRFLAFICLLGLFFYDMRLFAANVYGLTQTAAAAIVVICSFLIFFGLLLSTYFIEYRFFPVRVYADRIEVRDQLLLRENVMLPFRNIVDIKISRNMLQKFFGLKTVHIQLRSGSSARKTKDYWYAITDIKENDGFMQAIKKCTVINGGFKDTSRV